MIKVPGFVERLFTDPTTSAPRIQSIDFKLTAPYKAVQPWICQIKIRFCTSPTRVSVEIVETRVRYMRRKLQPEYTKSIDRLKVVVTSIEQRPGLRGFSSYDVREMAAAFRCELAWIAPTKKPPPPSSVVIKVEDSNEEM
ncbi:hypothetical protein LTR95_010624 [Oleoguttula sp. CCFEE 5521]